MLISAYCSAVDSADVVVEVAAVDVDVDAVDRVDGLGEADEVDVDDVVDLQAGELLDRLQRRASGRRSE